MDCANHSGVSAAAYCQNCGKALCGACARKEAAGQIFCEPCWTAWSAAANAHRSYVPPSIGGPSPWLAAMLGSIPGVGAMYNGQYIKGFVHVAIFLVLVSAAHVYGVFGLFVAAWIFYQIFDAYHTAKARRDGDPLPDPLGLNELSNAIFLNTQPPQGPAPGGANPGAPATQGSYQSTYQAPYQAPYVPPPGFAGPGVPPIPPIPPVPPVGWRRREPIGAVILIGLGVLFLLGQFDWFSWRIFQYFWPLALIGFGLWLIVRRVQTSQGGPPNDSAGNAQGGQP